MTCEAKYSIHSYEWKQHPRAKSCRVRRLDTRRWNRCRDDRGESSTNPPSAIWRFPMLWKTGRARGDLKKNLLFSWTYRRKPRPRSIPSLYLSLLRSHPASNSEHKLGTRDQKSWRGKPRQDLRQSGHSLGFPHARFHVATYFPPCYMESLFSDLEVLLLKPAHTARYEYFPIYFSFRCCIWEFLLRLKAWTK